MNKRLPLIHEIGDPKDVHELSVRRRHVLQSHAARHGGQGQGPLIVDNASAGGLGDPIERDPALQKADLDNGLTNDEITRRMYCIEASYDEKAKEWRIDEEATEKLREAKRKERLSRGVPVEKWWQKARQRIAG